MEWRNASGDVAEFGVPDVEMLAPAAAAGAYSVTCGGCGDRISLDLSSPGCPRCSPVPPADAVPVAEIPAEATDRAIPTVAVEAKAWGWECIVCGTCVKGSPFWAPCPECKKHTGRIVIKDDVLLVTCLDHQLVHRADRKCSSCESEAPAAPAAVTAVSERSHTAAWSRLLLEQPTKERRKLVAKCQALHLAQLVEVLEVIYGEPQ
jgi:hypothetical protein